MLLVEAGGPVFKGPVSHGNVRPIIQNTPLFFNQQMVSNPLQTKSIHSENQASKCTCWREKAETADRTSVQGTYGGSTEHPKYPPLSLAVIKTYHLWQRKF